jgi:hypothetical protein
MHDFPPSIPVCESADENHFFVEKLSPAVGYRFEWIAGIAVILFLVMALWQIGLMGGRTSVADVMQQVYFVFVVSLCAFYPIWIGLGTEPTPLRFAVGLLFCIPAIPLFGWAIFVRGIFWLITVSSIFWIMRVLRWRVTRAAKLHVHSEDAKDFVLVCADSTLDQTRSAKNWHLFRRSKKSSILDAFFLQQFEIRQLILTFASIGVFLAIAKLVHNEITLISLPSQGEIAWAITVILGYPALVTLAMMTTLGKKNIALRFAGSIALIFITVFVIVFFTTTTTIVNIQADWHATMFPFSYIALAFSAACFLFCLPRLLGYRLLRLPPAGYEKEI